jgi:hypothetical protein
MVRAPMKFPAASKVVRTNLSNFHFTGDYSIVVVNILNEVIARSNNPLSGSGQRFAQSADVLEQFAVDEFSLAAQVRPRCPPRTRIRQSWKARHRFAPAASFQCDPLFKSWYSRCAGHPGESSQIHGLEVMHRVRRQFPDSDTAEREWPPGDLTSDALAVQMELCRDRDGDARQGIAPGSGRAVTGSTTVFFCTGAAPPLDRARVRAISGRSDRSGVCCDWPGRNRGGGGAAMKGSPNGPWSLEGSRARRGIQAPTVDPALGSPEG